MRRVVLLAVLLGAVGLVFGYLIFGRMAGEYLSIESLVRPSQNVLQKLADSVLGIQRIRQNILISGGVGVAVGIVVGLVSRR
jgi:hypothetical protein